MRSAPDYYRKVLVGCERRANAPPSKPLQRSQLRQTTGVRSWFVGADRSLAEQMRRRRWESLTQQLPDLQNMRVLDLGGTTLFWVRSPVRPKSVTVINLFEPGEGLPWVTPVLGDGCDARELVGSEEFDLVFSNSLIEHL